jgi:hypothetical protein
MEKSNISNDIGSFEISGHSTKIEWAVYLLIAFPINKEEKNKIYVGKVGDNRKGCNPVVSRVGNHFSNHKTHSQIRNKVKKTEDYNYQYFYCHFGNYSIADRNEMLNKINELERELNRMIQNQIVSTNFELINPYIGKSVSNKTNEERSRLIKETDRSKLQTLCNLVLK